MRNELSANRRFLRRAASVIFALALLFSGWLSGAVGRNYSPSGSAANDLNTQLAEVWGEPCELRPIARMDSGAQVYETITFTYEAANPRLVPNLYAGGSLILAAAAFLVPQVTILWGASSLNCLGGTVALPFLRNLEPDMAVYYAAVTVSRYTAEEGAEPVLAAQQVTTYRCYENMGPNNTDRAWVDLDSAQTSWDTSEEAFAALAPS